jgi:hypothetical protein
VVNGWVASRRLAVAALLGGHRRMTPARPFDDAPLVSGAERRARRQATAAGLLTEGFCGLKIDRRCVSMNFGR